MIKLKIKQDFGECINTEYYISEPGCKDDIDRIIKIVNLHSYECTREQAAELWERFSHTWAGCWLDLDEKDDTVWDYIKDGIERDN